jgi:trans-aconitate 2-methyltransferase
MLLSRLPRGKVIAVDYSKAMLEQASRNLAGHGRRVEFVEADLGQPLPLRETVDAVFSTATFHWVRDHDQLFRNLAAVMRPGAQLVAQCGGKGNLDSVGAVLEAQGVEWRAWAYHGAESTAGRLSAAGFVDIETWLNPEPTPFESREALGEFLATVVLRTFLEALPEADRAGFVESVVAGLGKLELDYVRLNITARRG